MIRTLLSLPDRAIYVNKGFCNPGNLQAHERTRYSNMAVQTQHYRLVHGDKRWGAGFELYDHRTDPGETNNIIKEHPELSDKLKRMYDQWYDEMVPTLYNDGVRAKIQDRDAKKSI